MDLTKNNAENLFCVRYTDNFHGKKFYINYVSNPGEKRSIKLPEFMIELSHQPDAQASPIEEAIILFTNRHEIELSIERYLINRYGQKIPPIHLTEDRRGLVMNVHIFEEHARALERLPLVKPNPGPLRAKWQLLESIMTVIKYRIHVALDQKKENKMRRLSGFQIEVLSDQISLPTRGRASTRSISSFIRGSSRRNSITAEQAEDTERMSLIPKWPIEAGDQLFSYSWRDDQLQRSVHHNIIVSNDPDSLRLPKFMVDIAESPTRQQARLYARTKSPDEVRSILSPDILGMLANYHQKHDLQVFVEKDNEDDLVINLPLLKDHAHLLPKCFPGRAIMNAFFGSILVFYYEYFVNEQQRQCDSMERNTSFYHIGLGQPRETGRRAIDEEIVSLMFKKKGSQPKYDHVYQKLDRFIKVYDLRLMDIREMKRLVRHDCHNSCRQWRMKGGYLMRRLPSGIIRLKSYDGLRAIDLVGSQAALRG